MNVEDSYRRYFPLVRERCRRLLGDGPTAADVAQETFVRFLQTRVTGGDDGVVRWLYRCSGNLVIDHLRRRRTTVAVDDLAPSPTSSHAETAALVRSFVGRLAKDLPSEVMQAGLLIHVDGLTQLEAAVVLDVTERTVRRWLDSFGQAAAALDEGAKP